MDIFCAHASYRCTDVLLESGPWSRWAIPKHWFSSDKIYLDACFCCCAERWNWSSSSAFYLRPFWQTGLGVLGSWWRSLAPALEHDAATITHHFWCAVMYLHKSYNLEIRQQCSTVAIKKDKIFPLFKQACTKAIFYHSSPVIVMHS